MRLWRLSSRQFAEVFNGGYGLNFDGRWNRQGHPVTYCATSPSLCILEKLVHVDDPLLLPPMTMVLYEAPDSLLVESHTLGDLPADWQRRESLTQDMGTAWLTARSSALLQVPSAIVAISGVPDVNLLINHHHPASHEIVIIDIIPFRFDPRLLA